MSDVPMRFDDSGTLTHGWDQPMSNRLPVGPGSRGGKWHDPEHRKAYHRAWRKNNPEYRERERLRMARARAGAAGRDPADIVDAPSFPRPLPIAAVHCVCECSCGEPVTVVCGFCRDGLHAVELGPVKGSVIYTVPRATVGPLTVQRLRDLGFAR